MMKTVANTAPEKLELCELPLPEPQAGQVRIRTAACGICATDLEMIDGSQRSRYPQILGHEWSGYVDKCGPGVDIKLLGHPCVAENVLHGGGEVGFEHAGGYGEFFLTEAAKVQILPDGFPMDQAALIEPLAVAVRGLMRLAPSAGPSLIMGDGPIGLLMLMLLRHEGIGPVTLVGGRDTRLHLARELGASRVVNYHQVQGSLAEAIIHAQEKKFINIIDATKSAEAVRMASRLAAPQARFLLLGNYEGTRMEVELQDFLVQEYALIGSNASAQACPQAVHLATDEKLPLAKLITHHYSALQFSDALTTVRQDRNAIKVVLMWDQITTASNVPGKPCHAGAKRPPQPASAV